MAGAGAGKSKGQAGKGPPGPAVNLASILVVRKAMGKRFTWIYLLAIVGFAILFGLLVNAIGISVKPLAAVDPCCAVEAMMPGGFKLICAIVFTILIILALTMKLFERFTYKAEDPDTAVYTVEGMYCSHCEDTRLKETGLSSLVELLKKRARVTLVPIVFLYFGIVQNYEQS